MKEPSVFPECKREKFITQISLARNAEVHRHSVNGMSEIVFTSKNQGNIIERILFSDNKMLFREIFDDNGFLIKRISEQKEETFNKEVIEEKIRSNSQIIIRRLKDGFYGFNGKPALEIYSSDNKLIEEVWYEGVKEPGELERFGRIHRKPTKDSNKWVYLPARKVIDNNKVTEFYYNKGELSDSPAGSPAILEKEDDKIISEVRVSQGELHGMPAIKGVIKEEEKTFSYEINAEHGEISDIPEVPGMSIQNGNLRLELNFDSEKNIQSKEIIMDFSDLGVDIDFKEEDISMIQDAVRMLVMQKTAQIEDSGENKVDFIEDNCLDISNI